MAILLAILHDLPAQHAGAREIWSRRDMYNINFPYTEPIFTV